MSINIKQVDGLKRLSQTIEFYKSNSNISIPQLFTGSYNDLTDKPIVDGNAIIESIETTQSSFYVQDENGNTIALIDNQGVHSIDFYANGESVKQHMSSSADQLNDLSGSLDTHKANSTIHITAEEREKWNDPLSEEGDTLYINDALGNTIAIFDANGLTTTNVTIKFNGEALEISSKLTEIDNRLTSIQNKNNDQDGRLDGLETATEKLDFIDASESDNTFSIVDTHGNPIAQFDASGLTTTEVTIANAEGSPIQVGAKIEGVEGRVSTAESEIDTLQGQLQTLGNNFSSHVDDTTVHITASERSTWNTVTSKADQSDLNTTNQNLATEITNRQNADSTLQSNIETEAQIRANEDTAINERTAEIEASENGVLSITDPSGNPIAQFDENGLLVTAIQTTDNITVGGNIDSKELSADNIVSRGDIEALGEVKGATVIATGNVSAADVKTSAITSLNSTISTINNNTSALESRVSTAESEIVTLQTQTSTLIASDSGKSVRTIANEELAAALIPSDAQESLNTLQEIADWIQDHPEDAAQMNKDIAANTKAINDHINDAEPRFNALEEKTANIEDSAESDVFTIYDKNDQPGFQIDANGAFIGTLNVNDVVTHNTITTSKLSVGEIVDLEGKINSIDQDITDIDTQATTNKNNLSTEITDRIDADTQIRTDFAAADTQIRTDFAAADSKLKSDLQGEIDSDISSHNTSTSAHSDIRTLITNLTNNKQDVLVDGINTTIDGNKVNVSSFPYGSLTEVPTISGTTTVNVGGIPAGTTLTNKTLESVLSDIFFPYVAPSGLSISSTPSASTVVENGTTQTITSIKATYNVGSQPISSATLYKNGIVLTATPNQLTSPITFNIFDTNGASTTYKVEITDNTTTLNKTLSVLTFVDPYFYGVTSNAAPTDEEVLGSTKDIKTKGTKTYTFKPSNQRPFIAYPASYGVLSLISDSANFDWTADFEGPVTMNLVLTNQVQATQYYVYYQKSAWTDTAGFSFTFKY